MGGRRLLPPSYYNESGETMDGFTYNGVHSSMFHCYYIPDTSARFDTKADYEVYDSEPAWQNGGQFFGSRVKARQFSLQCFFEDINIETKEKMMQWLDRKTYGELIFDERPFVHYNVHPTKKISGKIYQHQTAEHDMTLFSGTFTVTFTAYDPFGYLDKKCYDEWDFDHAGQYCGIVEREQMPPQPGVNDRSILVYNCGTERCGAIIRIGGSAPHGVTIRNMANNNVCKLQSLPPSNTYLEIDSDKGTVKLVDGMLKTDAFEYNDEGYIMLEPCGFNFDNAIVIYTQNSNVITIMDKTLDDSYVGKYIHVAGEWFRIISVSGGGAVLSGTPKQSGTVEVRFVTMNLLNIEETDVTLNKQEIDYKPKIL